jgi:hypothetical protein
MSVHAPPSGGREGKAYQRTPVFFVLLKTNLPFVKTIGQSEAEQVLYHFAMQQPFTHPIRESYISFHQIH